MSIISKNLDDKIAATERSIATRRVDVLSNVGKIVTVLHRALGSPAMMLLALGVGFTIGRITEGERSKRTSRTARAWQGLIGGVRAGLKVIRAPTTVWLARLFNAWHNTRGGTQSPIGAQHSVDPRQ
jgi:hypothetical protein